MGISYLATTKKKVGCKNEELCKYKFKKNEILIKINEEAEQKDIIESLKRKLPDLRKISSTTSNVFLLR